MIFAVLVLVSSPVPTSPSSPYLSAPIEANKEKEKFANITSSTSPVQPAEAAKPIAKADPKTPISKAKPPLPTAAVVKTVEQPITNTPPPLQPKIVPVESAQSTSTQTHTNSFNEALEAKVLALSNEERVAEGLPQLELDNELASLSRAHSADMIARAYFSHTDPSGCGSSCRANAAGYPWRAIGENIYMSSGYDFNVDAIAAMVVAGWMSSPGHRANILGSQYSKSGIGVSIQGESIYVTAMYSKPRQ